jgi:four helix bundle protein
MATIKRFEDLECWQEARKLANLIYQLTKKAEFKKDFELLGQLRRSAISIMGNTAEGFHRKSNKDFMRFLGYSRSSIAETLSHCYLALDQNYIDAVELEQIKERSEITWKKINHFITYLSNYTPPSA